MARVVNARFAVMCAHYLFDADFCNVASGWDKGVVEKNVHDSRRRIWVEAAKLRWGSFTELNAWLSPRCRALWDEVRHPEHDQFSVAEMLEHERAHLMPMPSPFDGYVVERSELIGLRSSPILRGAIHLPVQPLGQRVARQPRHARDLAPALVGPAMQTPDPANHVYGDHSFVPHCVGRVAFSKEPTLQVTWPQIFAREELHIRSLADLSGKRVAVMTGSMQQGRFADLERRFGVSAFRRFGVSAFRRFGVSAFRRFGVSASMVEFLTYAEAFDAVGDGRVDAVLGLDTLASLAETLRGVERTPLIFAPTPLHVAAPLGASGDLLAAIDRDLRAMKADPYSAHVVALNSWLSRPRSRIPAWFAWAAGAGSLVLVLSLGWVLTLRRAMARVRTSEVRQSRTAREFEHVLANSLDVIVVLDADVRIERVSGACEHLWGYRPDEMVGHSPFEFTPEPDQAALGLELQAI